MSAPASDVDLDDAEALIAGDVRGALRSAALGGAQVRAVAGAVEGGALTRIEGLRPRSIVLVTGRGAASRAAALVVAALGARVGVPLLHLPTAPRWLGPLDVVVICGDDAGDPRLSESADTAVRRGSELLVGAPDEGPLGAAGAGRALALPPRLRPLDVNTLMHHLTVILAVLGAVETGGESGRPRGYDELADALDGEALRSHPDRELFHNPAKSLAARMLSHRVVVAGDDAAALALAVHGAAVLWRSSAVVASATGLADVLAGPPVRSASEFDDPDQAALPVRVFVPTTAAALRSIESRTAALPDADLVVAGDEPGTPAAPTGAAPAAAELDDRVEIEQLAVIAGRFEMAAAYLQLVGAG